MTAHIRNDDFLPFILGKMMGKMLLQEGTTEQDEMNLYKESDHVNYFIPSGDGFLCVSRYEYHVFIPFAWHIGKHGTLKEMVRLGKELYEHYTVNQGKPIYYSGTTNFYGHNSRLVLDTGKAKLWVFEPKNI